MHSRVDRCSVLVQLYINSIINAMVADQKKIKFCGGNQNGSGWYLIGCTADLLKQIVSSEIKTKNN